MQIKCVYLYLAIYIYTKNSSVIGNSASKAKFLESDSGVMSENNVFLA